MADTLAIKTTLASSSVKLRTTVLRDLKAKVDGKEISSKEVPSIVNLLAKTHGYYADRASRDAVRACLLSLYQNTDLSKPSQDLIKTVIKDESSKRGVAASSRYVMLEWCVQLLRQVSLDKDQFTSYSDTLLAAASTLVDELAQPEIRPGLRNGAKSLVRIGFQNLITSPEIPAEHKLHYVQHVVKFLTGKAPTPNRQNSTLLGIFLDVLSRSPSLKKVIDEELKSDVYSYYIREFINSRTPVPLYQANSLAIFFREFCTLEDLESQIIPAVDKSMLRSPEVVLTGVFDPLVESFNESLDLAKTLKEKLLKRLLDAIKSTNAAIRVGALSGFQAIAKRCHDESLLESIAEEILTPLVGGKATSADHKVSHAKMLAALPNIKALAAKVPKDMAQLISKEKNDQAIEAFYEVMLEHYLDGLLNGHISADNAVVKKVQDGLSDKKPNIRRSTSFRVGNILLRSKQSGMNDEIEKFGASVEPQLASIYTEVSANPLPAAQSGLLGGAYVYPSLVFNGIIPGQVVDTSEIMKQSFAVQPKLSLILTPKVYTKLSSDDDFQWALKTLVGLTSHVFSESGAGVAWAQAFIFFICGGSQSSKFRRDAASALSQAFAQFPEEVGSTITSGLCDWIKSLEEPEKDSLSVGTKGSINDVARTLKATLIDAIHSTEIPAEVREHQLIKVLVLSHHGLLYRSIDWIYVCQQLSVDPHALVEKYADKLLDEIKNAFDYPLKTIHLAAGEAAAKLAFVAPELFTRRLISLFTSDLSRETVSGITDLSLSIWRAPPDVPFVDVLAAKSAAPVARNKNSDIAKWEAEVRKEIEKKKGPAQKKLTADEQAKVTSQLAKEADIRSHVNDVYKKLARGISIISSLAHGVNNGNDEWMAPATQALLEVFSSSACHIVGKEANEAYLYNANLISLRLGAFRSFVGVTTLRAYGAEGLTGEVMNEELGTLCTRVLYRIRFLGEQRPLDAISLNYVLPLVLKVLEDGGVDAKTPEIIEEQLILALEILTFHTGTCVDTNIARKRIFETLIYCIRKYTQHYKMIKDCLMDLCRCISDNITPEEINVLVAATIQPEANLRTAVLQAIEAEIDLSELGSLDLIWIASHDEVEENAELARTTWEVHEMSVAEDKVADLLPYLDSQDRPLRGATARALGEAVKIHPGTFANILAILKEKYVQKAKPVGPVYDEFGIMKKALQQSDPWESRSGIALAYKSLAPYFTKDQFRPFIEAVIKDGCLSDQGPGVRREMIDAVATIISRHGKPHVEDLMAVFEGTLEEPDSHVRAQDERNEAIIILYGSLAEHLEPGNKKIPSIVQRLFTTLSTPSENVQFAVAECLPPLVRASRDKTGEYVEKMTGVLFGGAKYPVRRGAAYGLAGIVRGYGISALKDFSILATLRTASENKKDQNARQGALFAYELFSLFLGPVFEPYFIQILPALLTSFGDAASDVREACAEAAKVCFTNLSSYGVTVILPTLLDGLDESAWRSKKGACEMLGNMAYLAPSQLAVNLPTIIPPLTNVLTDTHKEVRSAANRSLLKFGDVISNPEIKELIGVLLKALSDPTKYTNDALDALLKVSFVHYLDAPSLALVVRILERGLSDRSQTKKKASQIIGSLAHLTERKDLMIHLSILTNGLKVAVVDPVPQTRSTASKALGILVEKLGEDAMPELIPGLMYTLKSETGAGDRLGSAQALSEVLAGLGTERLEEVLPTILSNAGSSKQHVREGFMSMFIFLPACFGNAFSNYLTKIIPPILSGLADDVDSIRDTALRAGRLLVKNFAARAVDLLLPELERGLADDAYRIRLSSVELVGDLLFNLTGITGTIDEVHTEASSEISAALLDALGSEKRDRVLSAIYICRSDTSGLVRNAAINVWKALVPSPRILKEMIPTLTGFIIRRLANPNPEQKEIAGQALSELVRKAGEGVLTSLLPTMEESLVTTTDADAKQGICIALKELITSTPEESLEDHEKTLISVLRIGLVDSDSDVRDTAADAFDSIQRVFGRRAVDQVLPFLLNQLRDEDAASSALAGLLTLLRDHTRANQILPVLIPNLLTSPMSAFNASALANLAEVASSAVNRRLPQIINTFMDNLVEINDEELKGELGESFDQVLLAVDEFDGLNTSMNVILGLLKHDDEKKRATTATHLATFFEKSEIDYSRYTPDCIRVLLQLFDDREITVVKAAWEALNALVKSMRKEEMESLVTSTRQVLLQVGSAGHDLPGFTIPKGINAILPIFLQGLMYGTPEQRTQSALAIADIIDRTNGDSLRPFVTQITGPLIRVVSEKSVEVKSAILLTLNSLLEKIPTFLKPFLPQLQRTFAKALADTTSEVLRSRAARALGTLITLTPRIDPLIAELVSGSKTPDIGVRVAMLKALYEVVSKAGANMGEQSRASLITLIEEELEDNDDALLITKAKLLGAMSMAIPFDQMGRIIKAQALTTHFTKYSVLSLNSVLLDAGDVIEEGGLADDAAKVICRGLGDRDPYISDNSAVAAGKFLLSDNIHKSFETSKTLFETIAEATKGPTSNSTDTKRLCLIVLRTVSRLHYDTVKPHLALLAPVVFGNVRDSVIPVKLSAEQAFLAIFRTVDEGDAIFEKYIATVEGPQKRLTQDWYKRVASKLAAAERERNEAGGSSLGLNSDEEDDYKEIMSVGKVDFEGWVSAD
ncbi:translational activator of GCN4 [Orbilia blumenaviensis]|uniref:eIF-2-alpha kinase activator GCN1 n=1 Tax=Orbilia blumenaviensis TaxID=1796055 RepID=A0AAV9VIJ5_9PEZI